MEENAKDVYRIGISIILISVLISISAGVIFYTNKWIAEINNQKALRIKLQEEADVYKFESMKEVSGDDIVEFINRYDTKYDYYIYTRANGPDAIEISKERSNSNPTIADYIWSEDYLVNTVFRNNLSDTYIVETTKENDVTLYYTFRPKD